MNRKGEFNKTTPKTRIFLLKVLSAEIRTVPSCDKPL